MFKGFVGARTPRIRGGGEAEIGEFPGQVRHQWLLVPTHVIVNRLHIHTSNVSNNISTFKRNVTTASKYAWLAIAV